MKKITTSLVVILALLIAIPSLSQKKHKKKKKHVQPVSEVVNEEMWSDLQGKWQSLDDKFTFFIIRDYEQWNFYRDQIKDTTFYNFYNTCKANVSNEDEKNKSGKYLIRWNKDNKSTCFKVIRINTEEMHLMNVAKGRILRYKKVYIPRGSR